MKELLIIFAKNLVKGRVKTRLAKTIGDEKVLRVYEKLLHKTAQTIKNLDADKAVFYSHYTPSSDVWGDATYREVQTGKDLGTRMENAFQWAFKKGYAKVVIIGTDLWEITPSDIQMAFDQLENKDAVIGPASDGGYYLIGLKNLVPNVFQNKKWSTNTVLADTLNDLKAYKTCLLSEKTDIDVYEDLQKFPDLNETP